MIKLKNYEKIIGKSKIYDIRKQAKLLNGKHVVHVNSTYYGGGVAEILNCLVPLMNELGILTGWRIIKGNPDFFTITKKFHNALQGDKINLSLLKKKNYETTNKTNALFTHINKHDCIIIHDPQPLPLINCFQKNQPWIWRCHIDASSPNPELWNYLKTFVGKYDHAIFSKNEFRQSLKIPQTIITPSIDPLSPKNIKLTNSQIKKILTKFDIKTDKPIISQISRFDKWKDPIGVIKAFKLISKKVDCRLVLLGSMATDDPEGQRIHEKVLQYAKDIDNINVICFENNILVNAVQTISEVVIQKSLKEGFGLTVAEALWKKTPVVAGNVGGIPLQVIHGKTGYLVNSNEECADAVIDLLQNPKKAIEMGENGHEHIKSNFLITRHLSDYLSLLKEVFGK